MPFSVILELPFCAIIMGWAPIMFVLQKQENYFIPDLSECRVENTSGQVSINSTNKRCLDLQEQQFMLVYLSGDFMNGFSGFFVNMIMDKFGTRVFRIIAQIGFTGVFTFGYFARPQVTENYYFGFLTLLGTFATPLFLSNIQISNLFGANGGHVIAFINGLYDAADGFTYIPKMLSENYNLPIHNFWLICLFVCSAVLALRTAFFMPKSFFVKPGQDKHSKTVSNADILKWTFLTWKFWMFIPWWFLMDLRAKFFLQSLVPWLDWIGDRDKAFTSKYTDVFSFLQIGAFAAAPIASLVMNFGLRYFEKSLPDEKIRRRTVLRLEFLGLGLMFAFWSILTSIKVKNGYYVIVVQLICVIVRTNLY